MASELFGKVSGNIQSWFHPKLKITKEPSQGMVARTYNPSTEGAEGARSQVQDHSGRWSGTLSQNKTKVFNALGSTSLKKNPPAILVFRSSRCT